MAVLFKGISHLFSAGLSPCKGAERRSFLGKLFRTRFWGIRFKLILITLLLVAVTTFGSSMVVLSIMNDFLFDSLIRRGSSVALSAATPAGFDILADDRLALDNLVSKIKESQPEVAYMTIVNRKGVVLAHDRLSAVGRAFEFQEGSFIKKTSEFSVKKVDRYGLSCFELKAPILFADSKVGDVVVGLKADTLTAPKQAARKKTLGIALLALSFGAAGAFLIGSFLASPIKRLSHGVSQLKSGQREVEVRITSRDEVGELTKSFNEMARMLKAQKESLESYARNLEDSYTSMVRILAAALDARDEYTLGHSERVAWLSLQIGEKMGMDPDELKELEMACFLHDIGKIRIPDRILTKADQLNDEEYEIIKKHPLHGAEILRLSKSLHKYIPAVLQHHEWYNGGGYPQGLKGEEIHLHAQIVAVADSFDAMTSSRPYRQGLSKRAAIEEIKNSRGIQFSPYLVDVFTEAVNEIDEVKEITFA